MVKKLRNQMARNHPSKKQPTHLTFRYYMSLGYSNKEGTSKKHYRLFVDTELEKSKHIDATPFLEIPLYRGKKIAEDSFLRGLFGKTEEFHNVGSFKAMITVMGEAEKDMYDAKLGHVGHYAETKGLEFSDNEFLQRREVTVRLYMIDAVGLMDKDADSNSDPYCVLKLGKKIYNVHISYIFVSFFLGEKKLST